MDIASSLTGTLVRLDRDERQPVATMFIRVRGMGMIETCLPHDAARALADHVGRPVSILTLMGMATEIDVRIWP